MLSVGDNNEVFFSLLPCEINYLKVYFFTVQYYLL